MTRKDFELIARVFAREISLEGGNVTDRRYLIGGLARMMATELSGTNPRFNRETFLRACGVQL